MEIVSTMGIGSLGRELDLEAFVSELNNYLQTSTEPNFTSKGMVTVRLEEEGPAYTVYRTGSFQIRGAKMEDKLFDAANRFRQVLIDIGVEIPDYEFSHATSVFMEDLGRGVDLETLVLALGMEATEYEPEQFPGLIYRSRDFNATMLVFASGKIIISGTTDHNEAESAIKELKQHLRVFES